VSDHARSTLPFPISDSVWLADGALAVAAGHVLTLYTQPRGREAPVESLFEHVALHNGPLEDYHPQMLLQLLLWGWYTFLCVGMFGALISMLQGSSLW
jgi:hypothetical protein